MDELTLAHKFDVFCSVTQSLLFMLNDIYFDIVRSNGNASNWYENTYGPKQIVWNWWIRRNRNI